MRPFSLLIMSFIILGCNNSTSQEQNRTSADSTRLADTTGNATTDSSGFPYNLGQPSENFKLPEDLTEISGIDIYRKNRLVCVNDEKGKVYIYDVKKDELKEGVDFGKKGDYEAIANVNDTIYVLSSNGNLHRITGFDSPQQQTTELKTTLDEKNDTEGLCYDKLNHRLLIACKKDPGSNLRGVRAVYAFDLRKMELQPQPAYLIRLDELKGFLMNTDKEKLLSEEFKSFFDPEKGDATFQPSEISIHPVTNDIYLISTVGKLMVVMTGNGAIQHIQSLNPEIFKQPEGICFSENGDMYISDEGRDGKGNILFFKYPGNQ